VTTYFPPWACFLFLSLPDYTLFETFSSSGRPPSARSKEGRKPGALGPFFEAAIGMIFSVTVPLNRCSLFRVSLCSVTPEKCAYLLAPFSSQQGHTGSLLWYFVSPFAPVLFLIPPPHLIHLCESSPPQSLTLSALQGSSDFKSEGGLRFYSTASSPRLLSPPSHQSVVFSFVPNRGNAPLSAMVDKTAVSALSRVLRSSSLCPSSAGLISSPPFLTLPG